MKLIYLKDIDKSILYQGFTIRTALLTSLLIFSGNWLLVKLEEYL